MVYTHIIQGILEPSWMEVSRRYLNGLQQESKRTWLAPLQTKAQLNSGKGPLQSVCESAGCQNSDSLPWVWELERSSPRTGILSDRGFQTVQGFIDYLQRNVRLSFRLLLTKSNNRKMLTCIHLISRASTAYT